MRLYNRYIIIVATLLLATTVILVALGQEALDIYYTIYVIEALVVTELFVYLNSRARRRLGLVSAGLFAGFAIALGVEVFKIIA